MEGLVSIVEAVVVLVLLLAMLFATKGIKEKKDKQARKRHYFKAAIFLALYLGLHALRLLLQGGI